MVNLNNILFIATSSVVETCQITHSGLSGCATGATILGSNLAALATL
jgi:hypothetical protein